VGGRRRRGPRGRKRLRPTCMEAKKRKIIQRACSRAIFRSGLLDRERVSRSAAAAPSKRIPSNFFPRRFSPDLFSFYCCNHYYYHCYYYCCCSRCRSRSSSRSRRPPRCFYYCLYRCLYCCSEGPAGAGGRGMSALRELRLRKNGNVFNFFY
jgi:hypothetical protein